MSSELKLANAIEVYQRLLANEAQELARATSGYLDFDQVEARRVECERLEAQRATEYREAQGKQILLCQLNETIDSLVYLRSVDEHLWQMLMMNFSREIGNRMSLITDDETGERLYPNAYSDIESVLNKPTSLGYSEKK